MKKKLPYPFVNITINHKYHHFENVKYIRCFNYTSDILIYIYNIFKMALLLMLNNFQITSKTLKYTTHYIHTPIKHYFNIK